MLIQDRHLERIPGWILESGHDINPVPADSFVGVLLDSQEYRVTNVSSEKWGGALLACKRHVPMLAGSTMDKVIYCGLEVSFHISQDDFPFLWAHETDLKCCVHAAPNADTLIPNVFDFSAQVDMSKGGMFQVASVPGFSGWVDTGILLPPVPGRWNDLLIRAKMDIAAGRFSVLSVNGISLDEKFLNLPLLKSNWGPVAAVQLQNEVSRPGVLNIKYGNVATYWSAEPF